MGHRELKRVPINFQAPLKMVWKGYINSHTGPRRCSFCDGSGYNIATKQIMDEFYDFADTGRKWCDSITQDEVRVLVDRGRLMDFTHTWKQGEGLKRREDGYIPSAAEVNAVQHQGAFRGHDAVNRFILVEARAKRLGVFGKCVICKGKGSKFPAHVPHRPYKVWRGYEPPIGEGYQLWETTSEGTPVSPVFASAQDLAHWCTSNATVFADEKTSYENWLRMFIGEESLDAGSLLVGQPGFVGAMVNAPRRIAFG